jgi:outer membrane immunogenic protein
MIRKFLMASASAVVLTGSAVAADLPTRAPPPVYIPPVPIFTWTGIYVGGQIGYAWGNQNSVVFLPNGSTLNGYSNNDGVIGGAHVGYNYQVNQFVVGLEGSVDGSSLSRSISGFTPSYGIGGYTIGGNTGVQGSIRGRVGYAFDRVLIYATGGVAFAGVNGYISTPYTYDSGSSTRVGWTIGGGLEYAVTNNWSIRAEYRYSSFGSYTSSYPALAPILAASNVTASRRTNENQVQVGFSYKFDTFAPPAPVVAKY